MWSRRRATAVTVFAAATVHGLVPTASNVLFGHAIKNGPLPGSTEVVTFQHTCTTAPCTVTQMHVPSIYPGSGCPWDWENGRVRAYVDGEASPSVDVTLLELAHVGSRAATGDNPPSDGSPFGNELFGKTASSGGVYTTVRIPFTTSITTSITAPPSCPNASSTYWFIIRGVEGLPVALGSDLTLPADAKLALYRTANVTLQPLQYLTIAHAPTGTAGALLSVDIDALSTDENFLEACFRFYPNNASTPLFLSSGTEDFFLSASYFDEGRFTTSQSGLTWKTGSGGIAAYKTHWRDLILWSNGMSLEWRNYEDGSCPNSWSPHAHQASSNGSGGGGGHRLKVAPATVNTLVWYYTWPTPTAPQPPPLLSHRRVDGSHESILRVLQRAARVGGLPTHQHAAAVAMFMAEGRMAAPAVPGPLTSLLTVYGYDAMHDDAAAAVLAAGVAAMVQGV